MRNKPKIVASIEARMTSSRLPGKVLMTAFDDVSMLEYMVNRVKKSKLIDAVIIATTINTTDEPIIDLCKKLNIQYFRGSENDVLERVLKAHLSIESDIVVELTGDCPLIDPVVIDKVISKYLNSNLDYVSNAHIRSYPDGFDVQVFATKLLENVSRLTNDRYDRENVSSYIYKTNKYQLKEVVAEEGEYWPELRVTLDDKGDYLLLKKIIGHFQENNQEDYSVKDVVEYVKLNSYLLELNRDARVTDTLYVKTLKND